LHRVKDENTGGGVIRSQPVSDLQSHTVMSSWSVGLMWYGQDLVVLMAVLEEDCDVREDRRIAVLPRLAFGHTGELDMKRKDA
jgi:hypothetical protein